MATDHNFKVKNGLTVLGDTLVVNHTADVDGTQVYIKKKDSSTNLMRWGEGTSGVTTYKWRLDQSFDFIGSNGSDVIVLKSSDGSIQGQSFKIGSSTVIDSSRNLTNIGTISNSGNITSTGNVTITGGNTDGSGNAFVVNRGGNSQQQALRVENSGEVVVSNNYLYAAQTGTSFYSQGDVVVRGNLRNDSNSGADPLKVSDKLNVTGDIQSNGTVILTSTGRNLQNIGTIQNGSVWINDGTNYNNYNENIRLFDPANGASVIAFGATGTGGTPSTSILGYSDRFETRVSSTWRTRVYSSGLYVNGGYYVGTTAVIDSSRNLVNIGTISSGAITSSSTGTFVGNAATPAGTNALNVLSSTNGSGVAITFTDQGSPPAANTGQRGTLQYFHSDSASYGSGNAFIFDSTEASLTVLAKGKLMTSGGLWSAPSSGTGAGTQIIDTSRNLINIGTINTGQGATEVYLMNQNVRSSDSPTFADLTVTGNLNITGDINSYNVTDLDVVDKTITLGVGGTASANDGGGIIVDGANAKLTWNNTNSYWQMNKQLAFNDTATTTNQGLGIRWSGFDKEGTTDFTDRASIIHTVNTGGHTGSVLLFTAENDANDGIAFVTNASSRLKHNSNNIFTDAYHPNADTLTTARTIAGTSFDGSANIDISYDNLTNKPTNIANSDTVDSLHASQFLRSDANDTATGVITFAATPTLGGTSSNEGGEIQFGAPTGGGSAFALDNYQGHFRVHTLQSGKNFQVIGAGESTRTTINTNIGTVWGSGNDGSGSGLDADTLDGQQGSAYKRNNETGTNAEYGPWYSTGTYIYDSTNGTRYFWLLIGTIASSSCRGMIEYEVKDDENYPHSLRGTVVYAGFNSGASFSVQHDTTIAFPASHEPQVKLDTSRRIWMRFPSNDWAHYFRFRVHNQSGNFTTNTSWSTGSTRYDTLTTSVPPNSSSDILPGQNLRATSSSVTGTVPSYAQAFTTDRVKGRKGFFGEKLAVGLGQTDVHGTYHLYNNNLTYLNGATIIDDNLTISGGGDIIGGSGTNITLNSNVGDGGTTAFTSMTGRLEFDHDYSDGARGPNKIVTYEDGSWIAGLGIHSSTASYYSGSHHKWYKSNSSTSFTEHMNLNGSGSLSTLSQGTLWGASNDGSGSGLDADLLDGRDTSDSGGANRVMITNSSGNTSLGSGRLVTGGLYGTGHSSSILPIWQYNSANPGYGIGYYESSTDAIRLDASGNLMSGTPDFEITANVAKINGNTVWHGGNDGSGSGLDADTLDGSQGTYYNHRRYTDSTNYLGGYYVSGGAEKPNSTALGAGKLKPIMLGSSNLGFGGAWNDVLWMSTYTGTDVKRSTAFVSSKYDNTSVWVVKQNYDSSSWGTGYLFWNSGNDGSGSGLDADLLDGIDSGSFLRSDTSDTMSGELNVTRNSGVSGSSAPSYSQANIELQTSSNNVPAISFHRGGYSATTLYEYDGELYVNPWTTRAQSGKLISSGNYDDYVTTSYVNGLGINATTLDSLDLHTGRNNEVNKVVRTDSNGYIQAGWINTTSGSTTTGIDRIYASNDGYIRYYTKTNFLNSGGMGEATFNNMSRSHSAYTDFNSTGLRAGVNYIQGGTNSPTGSGQWYGFRLGLGSDYPTVTGNGSAYASELYWARIGQVNNKYLWARDMEGGSWGSWRKFWAERADNLQGYSSAESGASTIHRLASNGYSQIQNWQNVAGTGIYSTTANSAHFSPNQTTSYGSWRTSGSRGGYDGIVFDTGGDVAVMFDSSGNGGFYRQGSSRWYNYHHVANNSTAFGSSTTSSSYMVYVHGAIYATGDVVAYSDRRIKENIITIDSALEKVNNLRGVYYNKIDNEDKEREIGFIAQEVNEVAPELVTYAEDIDQYGVKYGNTTALLVEAVKELTQQVKDLKQEIEEMKNVK